MDHPNTTSAATAAEDRPPAASAGAEQQHHQDWQVVDTLSPEESQEAQAFVQKQEEARAQEVAEAEQAQPSSSTPSDTTTKATTNNKPKKTSKKAQKWKERLAKKGLNTTTSSRSSSGDDDNMDTTAPPPTTTTTTTTTEQGPASLETATNTTDTITDVAVDSGGMPAAAYSTMDTTTTTTTTTTTEQGPVLLETATATATAPGEPDTITDAAVDSGGMPVAAYSSSKAKRWKERLAKKQSRPKADGDDDDDDQQAEEEEEEEQVVSQQEQQQDKKNLQASYQEIAAEKRLQEELERERVETQAEKERQAKEAERLASIARLEEERKQLRLEEERKAKEELELLQQQQQQHHQQEKDYAKDASTTTITPTSATKSSKMTTMIVLVSKSFGTLEQRTNQDRALTILNGSGIPFEEVDGSDPAVKERRNELFAISGMRGNYPQFFITTTGNDDGISFLGDFDTFQAMTESGELSQTFPSTNTTPSKAGPSAPSISSSPAGDDDDGAVAVSSTTTEKTMIALVSKSFGTLAQRTNQDRALAMLHGNGISVEEVDGSDPAMKERRTQLFEISGLRGEYPQFFVIKDADDITYFGDFEALEEMNEVGGLTQMFAVAETTTSMEQVARTTTSTTTSPAQVSATDNNNNSKSRIIVLVSKSFGTLAQKTNQDRALTMLNGRQIPFEEVDGSDPAMKDRRTELFEISGIRGKYPQFFLQEEEQTDGQPTYLGDFDTIQAMNEAGELSMAHLLASTAFSKPIREKEETPITPVPGRMAIRSVSSTDSLPSEVWENEFDSPTPQPQRHSRAVSTDSELIPLDDTFENEFDEETTTSALRSSSRSSLAAAARSRRFNSEDSTNLIPNETFENEFDAPGTPLSTRQSITVSGDTFENEFEPVDEEEEFVPREVPLLPFKLGRLASQDSQQIPSETFENEFDPAASAAPVIEKGGNAVDPDRTSRFLRTDTSGAESNSFDEDKDATSPLSGTSAAAVPSFYIHMAIGVLGVAAAVGMWLRTTQRSG